MQTVRDLHTQVDFEFLKDELIHIRGGGWLERRSNHQNNKGWCMYDVSASGGLWMVHVLNEGSHSNGACPRPTWLHAQPYTYS